MNDNLTFEFQFNKDNLKQIVDTLKDLSKIDQMIKIKLDKQHVLFYSRAGMGNIIHAFKSFMFPIQDFIIADEYINIDFIILNGSNFVKNLELMLSKDTDKTVTGKLLYKHKDKVASMMYISDGKLNLNFVTGDYRQVKDITKSDIENKMNPDLANFSFNMDKQLLTDVKKLSVLNKSETVSLRSKKGKLQFYDARWSLDIQKIDIEDEIWSFGNKYLKSITPSDNIVIYMFDQFLLFKEDNVALMIGLELDKIK